MTFPRRGIGLASLALTILLIPPSISYFSSRAFRVAEKRASLSDLQQRALETVVEMDRLLTTLATALIGAASAYAARSFKSATPISFGQLFWLTIGCAFAASSIICGYFAYDTIVWMLTKNFFRLDQSTTGWQLDAQFWLFIASVTSLAIFGYQEVK